MKKLLSLVLSASLVLASASTAFAADVKINNKAVPFTAESGQPFVDLANRTQVPFRATLEQFGATVGWNQETQTAIAEKDGVKVEVPIGKNYITKDGQQITNDTAALVTDGRTYLPIRAVLEAFGANVRWDNASQTVVVLTDGTTETAKQMAMHFIDVGQGDSIFIDYGDFEILIDAGLSTAAATVVNYIKPYVQGSLDVVVATHEHADHIGGLPAVFGAYKVDKIMDNGRAAQTKAYSDYLAAANAEGAEYLTTAKTQNITVVMDDKATYRVIEMSGSYADPNNNSVVSMVSYNNVQALLMGDAETAVEKANIAKFEDVEILKAGHHGSATASSAEFLDKAKPETVIVSAATGNTYKHPHLAAMQRFANVGAKTYGTFKSGSIVATTDGDTYSLNTATVITVADSGNNVQTLPPTEQVQPPTDNSGNITQSEAVYVGNSNTKKYHIPSCSSVKQISAQNVVYFKSVPIGYDACKNCNPK